MKKSKAIEKGLTKHPLNGKWGKNKRFDHLEGVCKTCGDDIIYAPNSKGLYCDSGCTDQKNKKTWNTKTITELFKSKCYDVKSPNEITYTSQVYFICPNKHEHHILASNFISGQRCGLCSKTLKLTYQQVVDIYEKEKYTLLTKEEDFVNSSQLIDVLCDKKHKWSCQTISFNAGVRCLTCSGNTKIEFKQAKEDMESEGYQVLTTEDEFKTQVLTKIRFICPNKHEHKISYRKWRLGQRCSRCNDSKEERFLKKLLTDNGYTFIDNDRTQLLNPNTNHYLELDIWFPEKKLGIEFNGGYWHSLEFKKNNDEIKKMICEQKGITLLIVTDKDLLNTELLMENLKKYLS